MESNGMKLATRLHSKMSQEFSFIKLQILKTLTANKPNKPQFSNWGSFVITIVFQIGDPEARNYQRKVNKNACNDSRLGLPFPR